MRADNMCLLSINVINRCKMNNCHCWWLEDNWEKGNKDLLRVPTEMFDELLNRVGPEIIKEDSGQPFRRNNEKMLTCRTIYRNIAAVLWTQYIRSYSESWSAIRRCEDVADFFQMPYEPRPALCGISTNGTENWRWRSVDVAYIGIVFIFLKTTKFSRRPSIFQEFKDAAGTSFGLMGVLLKRSYHYFTCFDHMYSLALACGLQCQVHIFYQVIPYWPGRSQVNTRWN